jgi:di/tricarboxylate transporter
MIMWVFPAFYSQAGGPGAQVLKKIFTSGCSAMFAAAPLLFIPDIEKGFEQPVMPWKEILKSVDLGVIFVAGGGICLGVQMKDTGLANVIANGFVSTTGINDIYMLILLTTIFTIFLTEVMSNLASITILTPVILAAALRITEGDVASALWPLATIPMAASCSFMMPWASPMNLMIINSGHVTSWNMIKYGFIMNMACALIIFADVALLAPKVWPQGSFLPESTTTSTLAESIADESSTLALNVIRLVNETRVVV